MKIIIISDGKYGDRAIVNIKAVFPDTELIILPEYDKNDILDSINLPANKLSVIKSAALLINYHRHPDVTLELASFKIPMIQAINNGEGFLRQIQSEFGSHVIMPNTMCGLKISQEMGSGITTNEEQNLEVFHEFSRVVGNPSFEIKMQSGSNIIEEVKVLRGSPCGATAEAAAALRGKKVEVATLNAFALHIRQLCREPTSFLFNRVGVEETAMQNHLIPLLAELKRVRPDLFKKGGNLANFVENLGETRLSLL